MRPTSGLKDSKNCSILQAFRNSSIDIDYAPTKAVTMLKNESMLIVLSLI